MSIIAVMVLIDSDDPRLDLDLDHVSVSTAEAAAKFRQAVIDNLPKLSRLVMVCDEEEARMMLYAHRCALEALGEGRKIRRPPDDYVPPTRE